MGTGRMARVLLNRGQASARSWRPSWRSLARGGGAVGDGGFIECARRSRRAQRARDGAPGDQLAGHPRAGDLAPPHCAGRGPGRSRRHCRRLQVCGGWRAAQPPSKELRRARSMPGQSCGSRMCRRPSNIVVPCLSPAPPSLFQASAGRADARCLFCGGSRRTCLRCAGCPPLQPSPRAACHALSLIDQTTKPLRQALAGRSRARQGYFRPAEGPTVLLLGLQRGRRIHTLARAPHTAGRPRRRGGTAQGAGRSCRFVALRRATAPPLFPLWRAPLRPPALRDAPQPAGGPLGPRRQAAGARREADRCAARVFLRRRRRRPTATSTPQRSAASFLLCAAARTPARRATATPVHQPQIKPACSVAGPPALHQAAAAGDLATVRRLTQKQYDLDQQDQVGVAALSAY